MATESTTRTRRGGRGWLVPGIVALAALLALGLFVGAGDLQHPRATDLVGSEIAAQIALGIQTEQDSATAPAVTCPATEPVRVGLRFQCTLATKPARTVYVTEVDGRGRVRWSLTPG